jgi:hypothetical protein
MKYMRRLILSQNLRDTLTVPQITMHKPQISRFSLRSGAFEKVAPDHVPSLGL